MSRLEIDPSTEQIKNNFLGEYLSEIDNIAKINVPEIKPSCIADVTIPISLIPTFIAKRKSPIMALPANQREVTANWEKTIVGNIRPGIFIDLFSSICKLNVNSFATG